MKYAVQAGPMGRRQHPTQSVEIRDVAWPDIGRIMSNKT